MSLLKWIGMGDSKKTTANEPWSSGSEKYFGLENFGNTCYCNSILQALYFCKPFRECVINFPNGQNDVNATSENKANSDISSSNGLNEDTLFSALKELFWKISSQKKRTGVMAPNGFIAKLKKENELFRTTMHQDAHEFLNYTLNAIAENVIEQQKKMEELERQREQEQRCDISEKSKSSVNGTSINESEESGVSADESSFEGSEINSNTSSLKTTWITSRDDPFLDLSIDIEQNSSVTSCLRQFSASEMLVHQDKFFCDVCCGLQEAEKRMKIKKLPNVLALHLKRFKYQERLQKYIKLSYRVVFPFELRLFNTCDNIKDPDRLYELYAICVHIGSGPYHGHYVTLVKSMGQWLLFDDDTVEPVDESEIHKYFGDIPATGSGYVLFYQACDLDLSSLGLPYSVWANNVASSASSEVSAEGAAESHSIDAQSTSTTINGADNNNNVASSINNEEPKKERQTPVREPSFSERLTTILPRKKDNNPDRRKSHGDQDSKDNDDNNTHEKSSSQEKEKTSWFTKSNNKSNKEKDKDKDKKDDKDEKKTSSNLESLFEEGTNNTQTSKKDKKAEKEEKKREKKAKSESKKMEKLAASNGIKTI
ncbi:cysteine proteinase [Rhizophagus irregularis]|uniref:Ubiquitin carboxyl-terminal hydrolase n=1 Tax=Rhizophagus irregularis TaxID=588596 RepID=A0A2N1P1T7_9GLOM|nr:cysteine proteinase [Rhizophagus irregularis]